MEELFSKAWTFKRERNEKISVADPDPGSVAFLTPESGIRIRDLGWGKNQDPGSTSQIIFSTA
jgi:hypothetical protein